MREKVTVIVPVYNGKDTIERCVNSLLNQSFNNINIIIVNDGSTDNTEEILHNLYSNNKKITLLHQKNQGVSAARNYALSEVKTKYVTFTDADDFVDSDYISNLLRGFSDPLIDLSINGIKRYDPEKKTNYNISHYRTGIFDNKYMLSYVLSASGPKGYLCNKMWKMDIIKKYQLSLDSSVKMAEDLLFTVNYLLFARKIVIENYCGYNYVHRSNSLSSGIDVRNKNNKFKETNLNYINAYLKIIHLISESDKYKRSKIDAEANLGLIYTSFLRQLKLVNDEKINSKIYKKIKKDSLNLLSSVIITKNIGIKRKIVYLITLINPKLMLILDKSKN